MSARPAPGRSLSGRRILVIEDEYFLADEISRELRLFDAVILGPIGNLAEAFDFLAGCEIIHGAVLDVNLRQERVYPLARALRARHVPFVFTTGYGESSIDAEFQDVPRWEKPLDVRAVVEDLSTRIAQR